MVGSCGQPNPNRLSIAANGNGQGLHRISTDMIGIGHSTGPKPRLSCRLKTAVVSCFATGQLGTVVSYVYVKYAGTGPMMSVLAAGLGLILRACVRVCIVI